MLHLIIHMLLYLHLFFNFLLDGPDLLMVILNALLGIIHLLLVFAVGQDLLAKIPILILQSIYQL